MKILQISTYDIKGGAARAAYRLHRGLREMGHDCRMVVRYKDTMDDSVMGIAPRPGGQKDDRGFFLDVVIQGQYIDSHRTDVSNTLFSLPYPGYDLRVLPLVQQADIINLHWVAQYQSSLTLHRLFLMGKPVVWTLHDQWPFTGGCHYAAGCEAYLEDCSSCPQLSDDPFDLPKAVLKDKIALFKGANLTLVSPSRWLAACAGSSRLFRELRIEVIPNAVKTDIFKPVPKAAARAGMDLTPDTAFLLFASESGNERRKGFHHLVGAVQYCLENDEFRRLVNDGKIKMICFGYGSDALDGAGIPVEALGYLDSDEKIAQAYCAADLFVLPSIEDNLPNTMLEAMSCGTPVVAFELGGMPDAVKNGLTGRLVPPGDVREMGNAILSLMRDENSRKAMGRNCRHMVEERFSLSVQAGHYAELYRELMKSSSYAGRPCKNVSASGWQDFPSSQTEEVLLPPLDISLSPNVKAVYDGVALKAMTELTPSLYRELKASNADREARLEGLRQYEETIKWYEKKLGEVQEGLKASNADREARLEGLRQYQETIKWYEKKLGEVQEELKASNADRQVRLEVIYLYQRQLEEARLAVKANLAEKEVDLETIRSCQGKIQELEERMQMQTQEFEQQLQAKAAAQGEAVRKLEETIVDLSTAGKALRILMKRIAYPSVFKNFVDRHGGFIDWISLVAPCPIRLLTRRSSKASEPMPSIHSRLVEAFVVARSIRGDMDDLALELCYQMGRDLHHVLCVSPSPCNDKAVYMMARGGAKVIYVAGAKPILEQLVTSGITLVRDELGAWMAKAGGRCLADCDGVVLDLGAFKQDLLLLKGRLYENSRIFITSGWPSSDSAVSSLGRGGRNGHGIIIVDTPPFEWLAPANKDRPFSGQTEWPWQEGTFQYPTTLPSGRPWPKISIVTATYNQGDYLEETLRSVLSQGYPNLEYIVVDGASTDDTPAILKRYEDRLSRWISEKDKGQADALDKGFRLATGDILAWLNSDDLYLPDTLMRVALAFDAYETDMVSGGCALVQGKSKTPFRIHHNALPFGQPISLPIDRLLNVDGYWQKGDFFYQPEVFWSRDIWSRSGSRVDGGLFYSMDYELWVRLARAGAKIVHVPDVLALFRMHDSQKTSGEDLPFLGELRRVSEEFMRGLR
jgi:glycosyltransferase involved in cell wall biosynthesis/GT2 family glycosyltransferase